MSKKEIAKQGSGIIGSYTPANEVDDGADVEITRILKLDGGITLKSGDLETSLGNEVEILVLGMKPLGRGCFEGTYDPKAASTPVCFSLDARKPHELARPPMIIDRNTGETVPASTCKGKTGDCPGMIGENTCGWKRHIVCVFRDNITESGLISFPIPSASLFHKGDVKNNPDPDNRTGFELYYKGVKSLPTEDGKPPKLFQVVTSVMWHKQEQRGEAFSFSCVKDGAVMISGKDEWDQCVALMQTDAYRDMLDRYDNYLIEGAKRRIAEEQEADQTEGAPEPDLDELAD